MKQRLPWLVVNLFTASLVGDRDHASFEATIATLVALAALMPIVASTGGIAGTQSLAVAVRALATRDLTRANAGRVVRRELLAGVMNGLGLAVILGVGGGADLRRLASGAGAGAGDDREPDRGGPGRGAGAPDAGADGAGPGAGLGHVRDDADGCDGVLCLSGAGDGDADYDAISRPLAREAAFARRKAAFAAGQGQAAEILADYLAAQAGRVLSGYMPMRTEIDPLPAMAAHQGPVGVPVIVGKAHAAAVPGMVAGLRDGRGRVQGADPGGGRLGGAGGADRAAAGLGPRGYRLGYGGGFYDRTLEGLRARGPVLAVGFAFAAQEVAEVPIDATDQRLDAVVTEKGVTFSRDRSSMTSTRAVEDSNSR